MAMARLLAALAVAVSTFAIGASRQDAVGVIQGRVVIADTALRTGRPAMADLGDRRRDPVDRRQAVVYLESAPRRAFDDLPAGHARMDQRGEQFVPRVLAITVGTTVEFPNNDTTFHNVFSLSRTKTFDLGRYPPRRTGTVTFDRPGIVPVFCDIHSHMSSYILVFSHPFFALTNAEGRFAIPDVPVGTYTLRVWSELGQDEPRRVTVTDREATDVRFQIGRDRP